MNFKYRQLLPAILLCISIGTLSAADPSELSLEENINIPAVPAKKHNSVKEAIDRLRSSLEKAGFTTGKLRQGEALMINIPCSSLFRSNEIVLSPEGCKKLAGLRVLENLQDKYKLLIAVHSDNTGDDEYSETITAERANAVDEYLTETLALNSMYIIPYGLSHDEPLAADDTVTGRATNRRVEIYIVPQEALFTRSK